MKLRRVSTDDGPRIEALHDGQWVRLGGLHSLEELTRGHGAAGDAASDMLTVLQLGPDGWQALAAELNALEPSDADASVMLPLAPASFRDFMLYESHVINATRGYLKRFMPGAYRVAATIEKVTGKPFSKLRPHRLWYEQPIYYFGNHLNFLADGAQIAWPVYTDALDYELELGAILARPLLDASEEEATRAIGGFVVLNDVSARDTQKDEMESGFGPQKSKHFINAMSSIVATADEVLPAIDALDASVSINGETVTTCPSAGMHYSLGAAIAQASKGEALHPGELFGSGTLPGGSGMENGHWLKPGDRLSLKIAEIGTLTNTIARGTN